MKSRIILFATVLFLGITLAQTFSRAQTSSPVPTITASLYDNSYMTGTTTCNLEIDLDWNLSSLPTSGVYQTCLYDVSNSNPVQCVGTWYSSGAIAVASGTVYGQCTQQILQSFEQSTEQQMNNDHWLIAGYYTNPDGSQVYVQSNIAQINNPYTAPLQPSDLPDTVDRVVTKDPINIFSGESYFSSTDFSLNGQGPKMALFRKYCSLSTFQGMFGYGWRTDFDANLTQDNNGDVIIFNGEGTGIYFMNNSGTYTPSPGNYSIIIRNPDGSFTLTDKNGNITKYDTNGRLSSRTDRNGASLTFVYNPAVPGGTYIQDTGGRQIKLYFDSNNRVISAADPAGKTFQYGYDTNGNLVSITDPTGAVTNYNYDGNHKIIQFTNANGHNRYYQYDTQGRATMNWQDNNINKVALNYEAGNTTVVTDSLGNNDTYVFNNIGLLVSHTDPLGAVTQQTWDSNMNKTSITDARNNMTSFIYDGKGNLIQITDPFYHQTNMAYTSNYNLISTKTDALGDVTSFVYDIDGNMTSVTDALGNTRSFIYDQFGKVITATDSRGNSTNFTYDAFGHIIQKTDALGNITNLTYE